MSAESVSCRAKRGISAHERPEIPHLRLGMTPRNPAEPALMKPASFKPCRKPVAPESLRFAQRLARLLHEMRRRSEVRRKLRHADRHRDAKRFMFVSRHRLAARLARIRSAIIIASSMSPARRDRIPRRHSGPANRWTGCWRSPPRRIFEDKIAGRLAEGLVEPAEVIQIEHRDTELGPSLRASSTSRPIRSSK